MIKIASKSLVQQRDKPQFHNTTTMPSRKRMNASTKRVQVVPLHVRLLSDLSFEKCLDDKQIHKGFKKMESDHHTKKKREEGAQKTPPYPMQEKRVHHWFNKDECGHQACILISTATRGLNQNAYRNILELIQNHQSYYYLEYKITETWQK